MHMHNAPRSAAQAGSHNARLTAGTGPSLKRELAWRKPASNSKSEQAGTDDPQHSVRQAESNQTRHTGVTEPAVLSRSRCGLKIAFSFQVWENERSQAVLSAPRLLPRVRWPHGAQPLQQPSHRQPPEANKKRQS
jgi:hypothetical protein